MEIHLTDRVKTTSGKYGFVVAINGHFVKLRYHRTHIERWLRINEKWIVIKGI